MSFDASTAAVPEQRNALIAQARRAWIHGKAGPCARVGNVARAARALGNSRATVYRKLGRGQR